MEIITDNGYYSEKNFSLMMQAGFDFITLAKTSIRWIKPEVDKHREDLDSIKSTCPFDSNIHGFTVLTKKVFEKERKYANHKSGANKGDIETFERRIYIHIYYNAANYASDKNDFESELCDIKNLIESGTTVAELSESAQKKVSKYFKLRTRGNKTTVVPNDKAIKDASKYHGFFVLVSNKEKDAFEALRKYRRRETIESFFEAEKQHADGTRVRVWNTDTLHGRMFVQFVALCYYEYFSEQIRQIKTALDEQLLEMRDNAPQNDIKLVRKLKTWVVNTPLYLQLQWFDTVEEVQISTQLKNKRWSTEMTQQDILYLKHLGMPSD